MHQICKNNLFQGNFTFEFIFSLFVTDEDDLTDVLNEVETIAPKWNVFGTKLGVSHGNRASIEHDKGTDAQECLLALLTTWLMRNYNCGRHGNPSWRKLAEALQSLDGALFQQIAANHS